MTSRISFWRRRTQNVSEGGSKQGRMEDVFHLDVLSRVGPSTCPSVTFAAGPPFLLRTTQLSHQRRARSNILAGAGG